MKKLKIRNVILYFLLQFIISYCIVNFGPGYLALISKKAEEGLFMIHFILGYFVMPFVILIRRENKKQQIIEAYNRQTIPDNLGMKSYIDAGSGTIHLLSYDYHTRGGQKWTVSQGAITIDFNSGVVSQTILFPHIRTIGLSVPGSIGTLSFTGLGVVRTRYDYDGNISKPREETTYPEIQILFNASDRHIAEAIRDRISNPFHKSGF